MTIDHAHPVLRALAVAIEEGWEPPVNLPMPPGVITAVVRRWRRHDARIAAFVTKHEDGPLVTLEIVNGHDVPSANPPPQFSLSICRHAEWWNVIRMRTILRAVESVPGNDRCEYLMTKMIAIMAADEVTP